VKKICVCVHIMYIHTPANRNELNSIYYSPVFVNHNIIYNKFYGHDWLTCLYNVHIVYIFRIQTLTGNRPGYTFTLNIIII